MSYRAGPGLLSYRGTWPLAKMQCVDVEEFPEVVLARSLSVTIDLARGGKGTLRLTEPPPAALDGRKARFKASNGERGKGTEFRKKRKEVCRFLQTS